MRRVQRPTRGVWWGWGRADWQLVGVTGMMLASKYEEIYPPEVRDFVYICDNAYTRDQVYPPPHLLSSSHWW